MQPEQQNSQTQPAAAPGVTPGGPIIGTSTEAGAPPKNPNSSQNSLLISEIREGMVVMNDGSFRAVVACQSINFDLMSDREREGIEYSYQSFLNSLYFPIQIFIRSQKVDIGPYMERLTKLRRDQDNMLLGVLMDDYLDFIDQLSQEANIMDKSFFIVVPYFPAGDMSTAVNTSKNLFSGMFSPAKQTNIRIDKGTYDKAKDEIGNRVSAVTNGLFQMGVRGVQLGTKELASLYYNVYNPDSAVRQPLVDFEMVTGTYVEKGQGVAPQPHLDRSVE
jgi:type IV secretory pathway VirB4 component